MMNGILKPLKKSSMLPKSINIFSPFVRFYKRKIIIHDGWQFVQSTAWIMVTIILILLIVSRIWPIENITTLSIGAFAAWLLLVIGFIVRLPKSAISIAWRVDQELTLKERFSSLIEFSSLPTVENTTLKIFIDNQRSESLNTLESMHNKPAFKLSYSPKHLISTLILSMAAIFLVFLPNPMDAVIKEKKAISAAAEEQAEKIEELIEEIRLEEQLSPEEKENLLLQLGMLAEKLRANQGDLSEALADLSQTERNLLEGLDPQLNFKQTTISSIAQQLAKFANIDSGEQISDSDLEEIMDALAEQLSEMDEAGAKNLSQSLQKMAAQAAQAGQPNLADALSALSQSALSGDFEDALQEGEKITEALNQATNQLKSQQSIEMALSQLQQSRMSLSQSSMASSNSSPGSSQGNQNSQGQSSSQGQNPGNGQSQGNTAGSGGGTKANTLPGSTGSGQAQNPSGLGQNSGNGTFEDQVFVPWERIQGSNDPLSISGQDTGQGQTDVKEQNSPLPGSNTFSLIPYTEVFGSYLNTAYDTLENSYIPIGLKEYVLKYFSSLEP